MDPSPTPGATVTGACPANPANASADANCQAPAPTIPTGGIVATANAGYAFPGGVPIYFQSIPPTTPLAPGAHTINICVVVMSTAPVGGDPAGTLYAHQVCSVTFTVVDDTDPSITCVGAFGPVEANATCQWSVVAASLVAAGSPTDNCPGVMLSASPTTLAGPSCPGYAGVYPTHISGPGSGNMPAPAPNFVDANVTLTATDAAGNTANCMTSVRVQDTTPPSITCPTGAAATVVVNANATCMVTIPDVRNLATPGTDNCGSVSPVYQSEIGTTYDFGADGCEPDNQIVELYVRDCFGNVSTPCQVTIEFNDPFAPTFTTTCASVPAQATLIATSHNAAVNPCTVQIPDLTGFMAANANCGTITSITQTPLPGTYVLPSTNPAYCAGTIDVTFTATDCNGNVSAPLTCPALLTYTDVTPPTVICPPNPIEVVIPFSSVDCTHGTATVTLAMAIAQGLTLDDCDPDPTVDISPNMFMCNHIGKSGLFVTFTAVDCFANTTVQDCDVVVLAPPNLTAAWSIGGTDFIVCPDEFPINILLGTAGPTPACGVWSGDIAVSGPVGVGPYTLQASSFPDLNGDGVPDPGSYSITYTVGAPGCHVEVTHNIMVSPQFNDEDADLVPDFSICLEEGEVFDLGGLLDAGSIAGGAFTVSTTGIVEGILTGTLWQYIDVPNGPPNTFGDPGTLVVTYTLTDCDGAVESDQVIINIDEKPFGYFTLPDNMCQDDAPFTPVFTNVPTGASISFATPAILLPNPQFITNPATGTFDPDGGALGSMTQDYIDVEVVMTVTNGVCPPYFYSQIVRVHASGDPGFVIPATICESAAPLNLVLTDPNNDGAGTNLLLAGNVTWTGTGVTDNGVTGSFNPADLAPGVYTICVTVGSALCDEQECHDIAVIQDYTPAEVALVDDFSLCLFPDDVIDYAGLLSATALPGGDFSVVVTGTIIGTENDNSFVYQGGCGTLTITHSFPDDCVPNADAIVITIQEKPEVGGLDLPGPLCAQDLPVPVTRMGTTSVCDNDGIFYVDGVPVDFNTTAGVPGVVFEFDPAVYGEGPHSVSYEIGDANTGCYASFEGQILVKASSDPTFTLPLTSCFDEPVALGLSNPDPSVTTTDGDGEAEVYWFGPNDPDIAVVVDNGDGTGTFTGYRAGTYVVCVMTGDVGCFATYCQSITVDVVPPVLNCTPLVRTVSNDLDECAHTAVGNEFDVTATDNCTAAADIHLTNDYPAAATGSGTLAGSDFPVGITQVIWTATDASGNSSSCTIQVVVEDNESPTNTFCPSNATIGTNNNFCGAVYTYNIPQFEDNCDGVNLEGVMVSGYAPGTVFPLGTTTVKWEYTDLADNTTATCTFTVTVNDDDNPVAVCQPNYEVSLDENGSFTILTTDIDDQSYDNCQVTVTEISRGGAFGGSVVVDCADAASASSQVTVTLRVLDAAGNSNTCSTVVTVRDHQIPDIECPGNKTVVAAATSCSAVIPMPAPTVTDNCATTLVVSGTSGPMSGAQEAPTPNASNATGSFNATLNGNVLTLSGSFSGLSANVTVAHIHNGAFGVAGGVVFDLVTLAGLPTGVTSGSFGPTNFNLTGPQLTGLTNGNWYINIHTSNFPGGEIRGQISMFSPVVLAAGGTYPVGNTMLTYTATDIDGNSESCSFMVTVLDEVAPTITCPASPVTRNANTGVCSYTVVAADAAAFNAVASDNCAGAVITHNYPGAPNNHTLVGAVFPVGTTTVTWIATDASGNQSAICATNYTVLDTQNPVVSCSNAPTNFVTDAGVCTYKVNSTVLDATATDNCPGVVVTHNYAMAQDENTLNGSTFPLGQTVVIWTATDASGNTQTCTRTITVTDNQQPLFVNCPTTMVMIGNDPDQCSGKLNWSIPVATDNCGIASITQTGGPASGSTVPVCAPQNITYTATDVNGLTNTCVFQILVVDTEDPELDFDILMPGNVTVECDEVPAPFVLTNNDVHDNCTPSAQLVINYNQVSTQGTDPNLCSYYNYTLTRTWTVTDLPCTPFQTAGNQWIHVQVITVQDTEAPIPVCGGPLTLTLDKFGAATLTPAQITALIAGTTDNCAPFSVLDATASQTSFGCANLGNNNVTISIADPCLNTATCVVVINVVEGVGSCTPQFTCASTTSCLNNATTLDNGQFVDFIQIKALAGQTWNVTSATNMFVNSGTAAAPTAITTPAALAMGNTDGLDNDNDGTTDEADEMVYYTISIRHVDGLGYMGTLANNIGQSMTVMNTAYYPTPLITNIAGPFCLSTEPFTPDVIDQYAGDIFGAADISFTINGVPATEIDPATLGIGTHTIVLTADAGTAARHLKVNGAVACDGVASLSDARLNPGCEQTITGYIQVVTTPTTVACNDLVQVSIEEDCVSEVTPDMVLEGTYACFDDYTVVITYPGGTTQFNPANQVNGSHAGYTLSYALQHPISGNLCWGHILVEDKLAPEITCPPNVEILCTQDPDNLNITGFPAVVDCSDNFFLYTDDYTQFDCAQNAAIAESIVRTFIATDEWGNSSTCTHTITTLRGEIAHIVDPADVEYPCTNVPSSLLPPTTGWPKIGGLNITSNGTGICGIGVAYTDQTVNICPGSYKIVRTWTYFDWCPANGSAPTSEVYVQYIKVTDVAPTVTVNCANVDAATGACILVATEPGSTSHGPCSTFGPLPLATVSGVCNNIVDVTVETPEGNTNNGGLIPGDGLPLGGPYPIIYRAEDECGNITEVTVMVIVKDIVSPVAVCDEITEANLSSDGLATVFAETFDDGSHDNCCLDHFAVRRMTDNCADGHDDTVFGPSVVFCCNDITASPITVVFRAYDCFGNFNDCMVQVYVNDKQPPLLISCPAPQRRTCDWYAQNLETQLANLAGNASAQSQLLDQYFGTPTFVDNCQLTVNRTISINIDQCLEGTITRTWTAVDPSGNTSQSCSQTVNIDHVSDWVVEFPADITINCGTDVPDFGEPAIFNETCELVAVSHVDTWYTVVPDACYKIARQWTVINWCVVGANIDQETGAVEASEQVLGIDLNGVNGINNRTFRDSWVAGPASENTRPTAASATRTTVPDTDTDSDPWDGFITYEQVIKVTDQVNPVFVSGCQIPDVCILDNTCGATITLPTPEVTDCSPNITVTAQIQIGGVWFNGFGPYANVAPGTYTVRYTAIDNCNNQTICNSSITIRDCKKPTPYCKNGLVIELMVVDPAMVQVWASDFNAGSFDNCPGTLKLSFSSNVDDIGRTYDCSHVGQQTVQMWVTDAAGNQDYCETFVIIQANMGQCDDDPQIAGNVATEDDEDVTGVDVQLSGNAQNAEFTGADGMYNFTVPVNGDYTITPVHDVNPLNGVTTFDLVLITKHILGLDLLDTPYKMIAADANKSNTITTFDLVQIRKLILLIDSEFPNNTSWRFVDKGYVFPNPANPWQETFPEVANFNNVVSDLTADFVAVKIGDVNGNASVNLLGDTEERTTNGALVFNLDEADLREGETYTVNFKAKDFSAVGYQFTLNFDRNAVKFVDIMPAVAGLENFGLTLLEDGAITTSWNNNDARIVDGETVFSIVVTAKQDVKLSKVFSVGSRYTVAEAYKQNGDLMEVKLAFNGQAAGDNFELFQNTPNPFNQYTVISFNLPEAATATLSISDVSGKVVKVVTEDFKKGYNEVKLSRNELNGSGILYYQLDTPTDSGVKMMMLVD